MHDIDVCIGCSFQTVLLGTLRIDMMSILDMDLAILAVVDPTLATSSVVKAAKVGATTITFALLVVLPPLKVDALWERFKRDKRG
jgi:hypothetical protein